MNQITSLNHLASEQISSYRERLSVGAPGPPDLNTLKALHLAHLQRIPFENLDIHLARPIQLDQASLYRKIVEQRRGGYCYELNGLFAALLRSLGYGTRLIRTENGVKTEQELTPDEVQAALKELFGMEF